MPLYAAVTTLVIAAICHKNHNLGDKGSRYSEHSLYMLDAINDVSSPSMLCHGIHVNSQMHVTCSNADSLHNYTDLAAPSPNLLVL